MASAWPLSKVLRTKGGFRQWIAAPKSPRVISNGSVQNHERWMGSNPGQEASPIAFPAERLLGTSTGLARSTASLHAAHATVPAPIATGRSHEPRPRQLL
jgi:hypothetical protein